MGVNYRNREHHPSELYQEGTSPHRRPHGHGSLQGEAVQHQIRALQHPGLLGSNHEHVTRSSSPT